MLDMASQAIARGDAGAALTFVQTALDATPDDPGARLLLAQAHLAAGDFTQASTAFAAVPSTAPQATAARVGQALALLGSGEVAQARSLLASLKASSVDNLNDRANLGLALALLGDAAAGVAVLQPAAAREDASARVRLNLALAQALAGDRARAMETAAIDLGGMAALEAVESWTQLAELEPALRLANVMGLPATSVPPRIRTAQASDGLLAASSGLPDAAERADPVVPILVAALEPVPQLAPRPAAEPASANAPKLVAKAEASAPTVVAKAPPAVTVIGGRTKPVVPVAVSPAVRKAPVQANSTPAQPSGSWSIQLGALRSDAAARDLKAALTRRHGAQLAPLGTIETVTLAGTQPIVRLFVGRFASQSAAATACEQLSSKQIACFARRAPTGDRSI
jgi:tetratricopeptide (TPR) repeat protein